VSGRATCERETTAVGLRSTGGGVLIGLDALEVAGRSTVFAWSSPAAPGGAFGVGAGSCVTASSWAIEGIGDG
jgi:hypothetical protein